MLQEAFGEHALSKPRCYAWFEKFKTGDFCIENEPRGRLSKKFEDHELESLLAADDAQTQEQLAEQLNCDRASVSRRLKALGKIQKVGKWIPY